MSPSLTPSGPGYSHGLKERRPDRIVGDAHERLVRGEGTTTAMTSEEVSNDFDLTMGSASSILRPAMQALGISPIVVDFEPAASDQD